VLLKFQLCLNLVFRGELFLGSTGPISNIQESVSVIEGDLWHFVFPVNETIGLEFVEFLESKD
jgi:hypothetical protein